MAEETREIRQVTSEGDEDSLEAQMRAEYLAQMQQRTEEEMERRLGRDAQSWLEESRETERIYPGFKLENECRDPRFVRLLEVGMDMKSAFEALHHREILQNAVRYTAQNVAERLVENWQSRQGRPVENGASGKSSAVIRPDVRRMTRQDREEMERRSLRGERISF